MLAKVALVASMWKTLASILIQLPHFYLVIQMAGRAN